MAHWFKCLGFLETNIIPKYHLEKVWCHSADIKKIKHSKKISTAEISRRNQKIIKPKPKFKANMHSSNLYSSCSAST